MENKKQFRVKETFNVVRWTYVNATSIEEAKDILEAGDSVYTSGDDLSEDWANVDYKSLEEVNPPMFFPMSKR